MEGSPPTLPGEQSKINQMDKSDGTRGFGSDAQEVSSAPGSQRASQQLLMTASRKALKKQRVPD